MLLASRFKRWDWVDSRQRSMVINCAAVSTQFHGRLSTWLLHKTRWAPVVSRGDPKQGVSLVPFGRLGSSVVHTFTVYPSVSLGGALLGSASEVGLYLQLRKVMQGLSATCCWFWKVRALGWFPDPRGRRISWPMCASLPGQAVLEFSIILY